MKSGDSFPFIEAKHLYALQFLKGMAAQRKLLLGSKKVPVNSKVYRRFEKTGDYELAVKEFYSVKPTNVRERNSYSLRIAAGVMHVLHCANTPIQYEPRHEKKCLRDFRQSPTQTMLYSHRR